VIWLRDENGYKAKKQSYWPLDVEWDWLVLVQTFVQRFISCLLGKNRL
jgi:hypothetical protein